MSEKEEAKRDGARLTPNSGRGSNYKGDSRWSIFTVDYKESSKSFTLNTKTWAKVCLDAFKNNNSTPALKVILGDNVRVRLFIVEEAVIQDYVRLLEEENIRLKAIEDRLNNLGVVMTGDIEK